MSNQPVEITTSLDKEEVLRELAWSISKYNQDQNTDNAPLKIEEIEVVEAQGFSGAEIGFFVAGAVASGITYDILKYLVIDMIIPRLNDKHGGGAAELKE
ncbi:hypothetical protein Q5Y75_24715 [Ruegeria sp. 2205SS24-7]|uniref:hypothetical protein n=1 Tax=Ruegeria discodermiae TaxID=3064389 RepID=UPI00274209B7|nr:hypothetical protein [Ruegeria sp. 2205SS24-7]MDP5220393.1 hypothetical protein [Ruegeria sp. 2205SS24-7]